MATDHRNHSPQPIDLSRLSQFDLNSLSRSSSAAAPHRCDDSSVIPKIDRSVFNESAGSRKQTFSRLRLAPRNKPPSASSFHIPLRIPEPVDEENSQIIALLQQLFGVESLRNAKRGANGGVRGGDGLVPVQVQFKHSLPESTALAFQNIPIDVVQDDSGQRKRKRGRPRKNENLGIPMQEEPQKVHGGGGGGGGRDLEVVAARMVNEKGLVVDVVGLGEVGDPFGEEVKRRTQGLESEEQLLAFLEGLNGDWGSRRKKRRIVQAGVLGDLLPRGWKIVLTLKRRAGRAFVVCSRYVSPDGHQFESCKEVSAYLLSFFRVQDISHLKSSYTDGSQQFSTKAPGSQSAGQVPAGDMKIDASTNCLHLTSTSILSHYEKQPTASSSIGSEKLNFSDENYNSDLTLGSKLGYTTSGTFRDFDHQTEDKGLPLMDEMKDANSVQGCSLGEDRLRSVRNEKLVGAIDASDACNLYIPLVFTTPSSSNNSGICQISDDTNAVTCIKSGMSHFVSQDRNTECYESGSCGNQQARVDSNGHGLSVRVAQDQRQKVGFESSMLAPNTEGKKIVGNNLEDRNLISSEEDMEISNEKPFKGDKEQLISTRDQSEIKDASTIVELHSSSEGFSLVPSQNEHFSVNSTGGTQTSMLKDSAEGKHFDSDSPISFIDERTCVPSGYINNVSVHTCPQDASKFGGVVVASNLNVADNVVTSCAQERSSSSDQSCKMDNLLHRSSESYLLTPTGNEHPSAFDDNVNNISAGIFNALKAVDACRNVAAVDAYNTTASIMQGRSQGYISAPLAENVSNRFDEQSDDGVNNANKSYLSEKAKSEAEMFQTDSMDMPKFQ